MKKLLDCWIPESHPAETVEGGLWKLGKQCQSSKIHNVKENALIDVWHQARCSAMMCQVAPDNTLHIMSAEGFQIRAGRVLFDIHIPLHEHSSGMHSIFESADQFSDLMCPETVAFRTARYHAADQNYNMHRGFSISFSPMTTNVGAACSLNIDSANWNTRFALPKHTVYGCLSLRVASQVLIQLQELASKAMYWEFT